MNYLKNILLACLNLTPANIWLLIQQAQLLTQPRVNGPQCKLVVQIWMETQLKPSQKKPNPWEKPPVQSLIPELPTLPPPLLPLTSDIETQKTKSLPNCLKITMLIYYYLEVFNISFHNLLILTQMFMKKLKKLSILLVQKSNLEEKMIETLLMKLQLLGMTQLLTKINSKTGKGKKSLDCSLLLE